MDALVPAFVAALIASVGDRPAQLAALLAARGHTAPVALGLALGHALAIAIAVVGAFIIAPLMTPEARTLLLAIALLLAGLGAVWARRPKTPPAGRVAIAAAAGSFVGGDGVAFLAFAFAAKGSLPVLAGVGALAGAVVPGAIAAAMGADWTALPLTIIARVVGGFLMIAGIIVGLGGLGLI